MSTAGAPRFYAGIGSRETPPEVLDVMRRYAAWREARGDQLRSGGAPGADSAFYEGLSEAGRAKAQVFLPGPSFLGNSASMPGMVDATSLPAFAQALETVNQFHPNPEALANSKNPTFVRNLMARNAMQVLGPDLQSPSAEVVAWTEGGKLKGGTAQALRIAQRHGVPITNLGDPATLARIQNLIRDVPSVAAGPVAATVDPLWARQAANGYEVSSAGDRRFSALNARLRDGRTIEEAYQLDVKGYRDKGATHWKAGKGRPPVNGKTPEQLYQEYRGLWDIWAGENPQLIDELAAASQGRPLTDRFASTAVNQARALAEILAGRPTPAALDYGRTFQIVPTRAAYDVLGMRGQGGTAHILNTAPGQPGWLGNPYKADDAGGSLSRQEASARFAQEFEKKYLADETFRRAAQGLVGQRVGYYKPDEAHSHLKSVQEWLASRDFAADNGEVARRISPQGFIEALGPNDVFVFGSNLAGRHGRGAALTARQKFGAEYGVGEGLTGQSYALPTKDAQLQVVSPERLVEGLARLATTAKQTPDKTFLLTRVGQGLAGMDEAAVRGAVESAGLPENVRPWWTWEGGPESPAAPPAKESLQQLELAIDQVTPGKVRWAGQVLPVLALAASIGLGGAALAKAVAHPDGIQG